MIAKCEECGKEYRLAPGEKTSDFQCECGGKLSPIEVEIEPIKSTKPNKQRKSNFEHTKNIKAGEFELNELFTYEEEASRIELFVRIVYAIPIGVLLFFYSIVAGLVIIVQWLTILFTEKRNEGLNDFIRGYLEYYVHLISYFSIMTDIRPEISPGKEKVKIYEVIE